MERKTTFISSDEAARLLGISKAYLYKLTHERKLPCYKPRGGALLFDPQELDEYVRAGRVKPRQELAVRAEDWLNNRGEHDRGGQTKSPLAGRAKSMGQ